MQKRTLFLSLALAASFNGATARQPRGLNYSVFFQRHTGHRHAPPPPSLPLAAGWTAATDPVNGAVNELSGPPLALPGKRLEEKAAYCLEHVLTAAGLRPEQWHPVRPAQPLHTGMLEYRQTIAGHEVSFSRLRFRFTPEGRLQRIRINHYGSTASGEPALPPAGILQAAVSGLHNLTLTSQQAGNDWVWFPVPSDTGYMLHPAWTFTLEGRRPDGVPLRLRGYVDALDGRLLYRNNEVREALDLTVRGLVQKINYTLGPASAEPFPHLKITLGGSSYYTDAAGAVSLPGITLPAIVPVPLEGKWSRILSPSGSTYAMPVFNDTINSNPSVFLYPSGGPSGIPQVNAYYHINRAHDFMKGYLPSFTGMDTQLPTFVDLPGNCNAYYNGSSINFLSAGGGCVSFAELGDIAYHEYGHGISEKFYQSLGTGGLQNGALHEGNSDTWAFSITRDPVLGRGSSSNGSTERRYDLAPKVYPYDLAGEPHADGEIIAGAWWDVALNTGSVDTMTHLFTRTYYDLPDGPDGTEGEVFYDVLISALMNDDNDGNLLNGSPHFTAIARAFGRHGIYLFRDISLAHTEPANPPAGAPASLSATITAAHPEFLDSLQLVYTVRGSGHWDTLAMSRNGLTFSGQLPPQAQGAIIDYYFVVQAIFQGNKIIFPTRYDPAAPGPHNNIPYQLSVGYSVVQNNHFDGPAPGWSIGNNPGDAATAGIWVRETPVGAFAGSIPSQPSSDHTSGSGQCLVTGNAAASTASTNTADVDGGATSVLSPVFDLSSYADPVIEYHRWFSNDLGSGWLNDPWQVQIQDVSTGQWQTVEFTYQSDNHWRRKIFRVSDLLPGGGKQIRLRFIASDSVINGAFQMGQSTVEAALDDFSMYDKKGSTGAGLISAEELRVFPNPADHTLQVTTGPGIRTGQLELYDSGGTLVSSAPLHNTHHQQLGTGALPPGHYLLVLRSGSISLTRKVTVRH